MLYTFLKSLYKVGLAVFFRKLEVRNRHLIPARGPLLVVANHPNTFMDPVVIAALLKQPAYFIAKSTVFGSSLQSKILRRMNLIPIHRREDAPDQPISNEEAFEASYRALAQHKTILIFPEGNSINQRRLRKLKTGTARIALGAEANQNHALGVRILPIGLNYSAPTRFRSEVFVNIGKPIAVQDYVAAYKENEKAAVIALTEKIQQQLEKLIINTPTDAEDELARQIETVYKGKLVAPAAAAIPGHEQKFLVTKGIIKSIKYFTQTAPARVEALKHKLDTYLLQLDRMRLQDAVLGKGRSAILGRSITATLLLILGFPVYLYGLLHNYIPYTIPARVAQKLTKEEEWHAPIMLTVGIFTFPLFYLLAFWIFRQLNTGMGIAFLYLLSLPITGFFTLAYWRAVCHTQAHWLLLRLFFKRESLVAQLQQQRREIINELEQARQDYLNEAGTSPK